MATELPKSPAIEGIKSAHEEDGFNLRSSANLRGTDTDEYEMRILGKIQQLNVRISQVSS